MAKAGKAKGKDYWRIKVYATKERNDTVLVSSIEDRYYDPLDAQRA